MFRRNRFVWNEPWFFVQRNRTALSWFLFSIVLSLVFVGVAALMLASIPPGDASGYINAFGFALMAAASVWFLFDGVNVRRKAILDDEALIVDGDMGKYSHADRYRLVDIDLVALFPPDETDLSVPVCYLRTVKGDEEWIGIENSVSLPRLAETFHDVGVQTHLRDWQPGSHDLMKSFGWSRESPAQPTARMHLIGDDEPSLISPPTMIWAIVQQMTAILLALGVIGYAIYYGYVHWDRITLVEMILVIGVPIAVMYVAGVFTERYASAATSKTLVKMSRRRIADRSGAAIDPDDEGLIPVEVFEPDQMPKTIQKMAEMGFVNVTADGSPAIRFEGKKQRWTLPADSIAGIEMEEVQTGAAGQSATGMLQYYVMIEFRLHPDDHENELGIAVTDPMRLGLRHADRDYGDWNDTKRAREGVELFEKVMEVV